MSLVVEIMFELAFQPRISCISGSKTIQIITVKFNVCEWLCMGSASFIEDEELSKQTYVSS